MSEQLTTEHETDHEGGAMSTTTGKTLPRYDFRGRRPDARGLVEPLAPLLTEKLTDAPELTQHRELVGHFQAAQAKAIELAAELEIAKREDEERRRAALTKGRKAPAPKAAGVEVQLEEARKDTEMLGQVVVESASKLLAAAMPHLAEADDESSAVVESALDETGSLIDAALAALDRSETAAGQSGWLAQLHQQGVVSPWREGQRAMPAPSVRQLLGQAKAALDYDRGQGKDRRERMERERAEAMANLPPGQEVWAAGKTLRVSEQGEAEEVER
ncbi:MAG TPA: hypothetical protein VFC61_01095 [Blastocatellia bacterium]|jgi:hypothetical protein|nr:hypothetical protein [Blastocatellia bacterium]